MAPNVPRPRQAETARAASPSDLVQQSDRSRLRTDQPPCPASSHKQIVEFSGFLCHGSLLPLSVAMQHLSTSRRFLWLLGCWISLRMPRGRRS